MIINYNTKTIQLKIVYYGCAMSGKTTSLKSLLNLIQQPVKLNSIETTSGRTLFFDYGTLQLSGSGWNVKIHLYSATGQDFYASTRPATLMGADGLLFIADSQRTYLHDNIQSWKELKYFYSENIYKIPIVICLNKQDLPDLSSYDEITTNLELDRFEKVEIFKTIALRGSGVVEAFKKMLEFLFPSIMIKNK